MSKENFENNDKNKDDRENEKDKEKNDKNSEKESDAENKLDNESEIKKYFERFKNANEGNIPVLKGESENDIIKRMEAEGWKFIVKVRRLDLDANKIKKGRVKAVGLGFDGFLIFWTEKEED